MKWIFSFVIKSVLGFVAIKKADMWYVKAIGIGLAVWAVGDLLWLWNTFSGRTDGAGDVAQASFNVLASGLGALAGVVAFILEG